MPSMAIVTRALVGILPMGLMEIGYGLLVITGPLAAMVLDFSILLNGSGFIVMAIIILNQQML